MIGCDKVTDVYHVLQARQLAYPAAQDLTLIAVVGPFNCAHDKVELILMRETQTMSIHENEVVIERKTSLGKAG